MSNSNIYPFNEVTMKQSALKIILVDENMGLLGATHFLNQL